MLYLGILRLTFGKNHPRICWNKKLCSKKEQIWNLEPKILYCVFLACNFVKVLPYLKSAPSSLSKNKFLTSVAGFWHRVCFFLWFFLVSERPVQVRVRFINYFPSRLQEKAFSVHFLSWSNFLDFCFSTVTVLLV